MKRLERVILLMSLPVWACCLCCDPDKPVDVGVTVSAPCPEATPPPPPQQPYEASTYELEGVKIIESYPEQPDATGAAYAAWYKKYHAWVLARPTSD
jgi:hypothetical protein